MKKKKRRMEVEDEEKLKGHRKERTRSKGYWIV